MRILIRTSRLASWSRRFASFALPLAVIPVFLHRAQVLDSETFIMIEVIAMGCALVGFVLGCGAYVRLWFTGDRGWGKATAGIAMGLICLSPVAAAIVMAQIFPSTSDVITEPGIDIALTSIDPVAGQQPSREDLVRAFPDFGPRTYELGANAVYRVVESLMEARGWEITERAPPQLEDASSQINALDTTLLGWRDEFAVRIEGNFARSRVIIRSASGTGEIDFGTNGRRIEAFLIDLDEAVTQALLTAPIEDGPPVPQVKSRDNG